MDSLTSLLNKISSSGFTLHEIEHMVKAKHIAGSKSNIAEALSRLQFQRFGEMAPEVDATAYPCPDFLWGLIISYHPSRIQGHQKHVWITVIPGINGFPFVL